MSSQRPAVPGALAALVVLALAGSALGNGETQREVQGRLVAVDARAGSLVVAQEFRGKTARVTLRIRPGTAVFSCGEGGGLDRVKPGMVISVFYEVLGAEGVANLVVVEPPR
jgi:hypothetical protein